MKSKVILENKTTKIIFTPENEFEVDIIEKIHCDNGKFHVETNFNAQYNYGGYSKHEIVINIIENEKKWEKV